MPDVPLAKITATVTKAERSSLLPNGQGDAAIQAWLAEAAEFGIDAELVGLPTDGFNDGTGGMMLALARVEAVNVVLIISDPHNSQGDTNTITAREARGEEARFFSADHL